MTPFTEKVIRIIQDIPQGKVMTYGQIAEMSGSPRAARQVVRILHSMSKKYRLPWHRVINSQGKIGLRDSDSYKEQKWLLEGEGIVFQKDDSVDLRQFQFRSGKEGR
ncbi:MGMT family protein [Bacillaceae bacterium Marseille-Q3522]|nr:MGMT family protein [Bacillaceae bacterium Marseille-Q3522]